MFIVARHKGAQHGLKGQVVLVPTDLKKIQSVLPRSTNNGHIISLALKRRLTDKSSFSKQHIRPAAVNQALQKLKEINHFYKDVVISDNWEDVSNETDPELWNRLTDVDNHDSNNSESDTDNEDGNHDDYEENQRCGNILLTFMHSMDGTSIGNCTWRR